MIDLILATLLLGWSCIGAYVSGVWVGERLFRD